jgi:hypothetical protein
VCLAEVERAMIWIILYAAIAAFVAGVCRELDCRDQLSRELIVCVFAGAIWPLFLAFVVGMRFAALMGL